MKYVHIDVRKAAACRNLELRELAELEINWQVVEHKFTNGI